MRDSCRIGCFEWLVTVSQSTQSASCNLVDKYSGYLPASNIRRRSPLADRKPEGKGSSWGIPHGSLPGTQTPANAIILYFTAVVPLTADLLASHPHSLISSLVPPFPSSRLMPSFPVTLTSCYLSQPMCWPLSSLTNISPIILSASPPFTVLSGICHLYKLHCLWNPQFIPILQPLPFLTAPGSNNLTAKILIYSFSPINLCQHFLTI